MESFARTVDVVFIIFTSWRVKSLGSIVKYYHFTFCTFFCIVELVICMEEFSKRLIMLRKENDLSQFGLGLELGVSRSTIAGYEAKGRQPDIGMLINIADYFNVSLDYLVGRTDER